MILDLQEAEDIHCQEGQEKCHLEPRYFFRQKSRADSPDARELFDVFLFFFFEVSLSQTINGAGRFTYMNG